MPQTGLCGAARGGVYEKRPHRICRSRLVLPLSGCSSRWRRWFGGAMRCCRCCRSTPARSTRRFMTVRHLRARIVEITGNRPIDTLTGAHPCPKRWRRFPHRPATGNSLAKLAGGIFDTPALLAPRTTCATTGTCGRLRQRWTRYGGAETSVPALTCQSPLRTLRPGRPGEKAAISGSGFCADPADRRRGALQRAAPAHAPAWGRGGAGGASLARRLSEPALCGEMM